MTPKLAHNAPHWVDIGTMIGAPGAQWTNSQNGDVNTAATNIERYGTSWMSDLLLAKRFADEALQGQRDAWFNGAVDGNHSYTPYGHGSHDLGMAFDLGISQYINQRTAQLDPMDAGNSGFALPSIAVSGWSVANAVTLSQALVNNVTTLNQQRDALRDLLALYAVTQRDTIAGNGTFEDLPVTHGDAVRSGLFGAGTQAGGLISNVFIGGTNPKDENGRPLLSPQNEYKRMREVLDALGIRNSNYRGHQNHFHVYLRPPDPLAFNRQTADEQGNEPGPALEVLSQKQLDDWFSTAIAAKGERLMFVADLPLPEPSIPQAQIVAKAPRWESTSLVTCGAALPGEAPGVASSATNAVQPAEDVAFYFRLRKGLFLERLASTATVTLVSPPKHGALVPREGGFQYVPTKGFRGTERISFRVEIGGHKVLLEQLFVVTDDAGANDAQDRHCPVPWREIKIRPAKSALFDWTYMLGYAAPQMRVAELAGSALAQIVGQSITFDTTAAGHGWFIDPTPLSNEEYLPTADPNIWQAKANSEADGKMDLLTVLLHEHGHALGLQHSASSHDAMAASLQPGVRRLPTTDELALMSRLVAELRAQPDPGTTLGDNEQGGNEPPTQPLLPAGQRTTSTTRMARRTPAGNDPRLAPNHQGAVNVAFTNGDFGADGTEAWVAEGTVNPGADAVTLGESGDQQTHLAQAFMVNAGDRALRFTLDPATLRSNASGPSDAFEVALLNANGMPKVVNADSSANHGFGVTWGER